MTQNLLFVALAFQNGLLSTQQTLASFQHCCQASETRIDQWLVEMAWLSEDDGRLLLQLMERRFGNDIETSQADVDELFSSDAIRTVLNQLDEQQLESLLTIPWVAPTVRSIMGKQAAAPVPVRTPSGDDERSRFRIISKHAEGGLGVVYLAEDRQIARTVALKQIKQQQADESFFREKFQFEAEVTGQLEHPGIVPIYALGSDDAGRPFYAMRFIKGESLRDYIQDYHRRLREERLAVDGPELRSLVRRLIDVCEAIAYAHQRGVLHRDLKPGNIMLGKFGETLVVDWGLAKSISANEPQPTEAATDRMSQQIRVRSSDSGSDTEQGSFVGTLAYAPPEQLRGDLQQLGPASDVYSLGAILYEMLTSKPPVVGKLSAAEALDRIRSLTSDKALGGVPGSLRSLVAICHKAMAFGIEQRYRDSDGLKDDLQNWLDDQAVVARPDSLPMRVGRWLRLHRSAATATAVSMLVIAISSIAFAVVMNGNARRERQLRVTADVLREQAQVARQNAELATAQSVRAQQQLAIDAAASARMQGQFAQATRLMLELEQSRPLSDQETLQLAKDQLHALNTTEVVPALERLSLDKLSATDVAQYKLILGDHLLMGKEDFRGLQLLRDAIESRELIDNDLNYALGLIALTPLECVQYLDLVLEKEPFHPYARFRRALTNIVIGRIAAARQDALFGIEAFGQDPRYRLLLALVETVSGNITTAGQLTQELVAEFPQFAPEISAIEFLWQVQDFLDRAGFMSTAEFYASAAPLVVSVLTKLQGLTGSNMPRTGWYGAFFKVLPKSTIEAAMLAVSVNSQNVLVSKIAELAPDNQLVRFAKYSLHMAGLGDPAADGYQLAQEVLQAEVINPSLRNICLWTTMVNVVFQRSADEDPCYHQLPYIELVAGLLEDRAWTGQFRPAFAASSDYWSLLIRNGFHGPALLLADEQLSQATTDEQKQFWEERVRVNKQFEAQRLERFTAMIQQLNSPPQP